MVEDDSTSRELNAEADEELDKLANEVLFEVFRLEQANLHLERPRVRKELVQIIKDHVR